MSDIDGTYIIEFRETKTPQIFFKVGKPDEEYTLFRLKGKNTPIIFTRIIETLSKHGVIQSQDDDDKKAVRYVIREDIGPVIGGILLLLRRSPKPQKWLTFLRELLSGEFLGLPNVITNFLESAIELSRYYGASKGRISPEIADIISATLKTLISKINKLIVVTR